MVAAFYVKYDEVS